MYYYQVKETCTLNLVDTLFRVQENASVLAQLVLRVGLKNCVEREREY